MFLYCNKPKPSVCFGAGLESANPVPMAAAAFAQCITGARVATTLGTGGGGDSHLYMYE